MPADRNNEPLARSVSKLDAAGVHKRQASASPPGADGGRWEQRHKRQKREEDVRGADAEAQTADSVQEHKGVDGADAQQQQEQQQQACEGAAPAAKPHDNESMALVPYVAHPQEDMEVEGEEDDLCSTGANTDADMAPVPVHNFKINN